VKKKIGLLIPFSGEYPYLKRVLLKPFAAYAEDTGCEIIKEFIDKGTDKDVSKAIDKLFYHDDADIIVGYVGYRVAIQMFDKLRNNPEKLFINLSMGEIIPYTHSIINYPPNYYLVSSNAWKSIAFLGNWVANELPAENCLICTSLYDAGYSLNESFRIGYHSQQAKSLQSCTLNNPPDVIDVSVLYSEIIRLRPEHLHITLCGKELHTFINNFSTYIDPDYTPSISFAFPVGLNEANSLHPSFSHTYTCLIDHIYDNNIQDLAKDPIAIIFNNLAEKAISILRNDPYNDESEIISILEMDMIQSTINKNAFSGSISESLYPQFNFSAEQTLSAWQNPYLCI